MSINNYDGTIYGKNSFKLLNWCVLYYYISYYMFLYLNYKYLIGTIIKTVSISLCKGSFRENFCLMKCNKVLNID